MPILQNIFRKNIKENVILEIKDFDLSDDLINIFKPHIENKTINNINETIINKALVGTGFTVTINKTLLQ